MQPGLRLMPDQRSIDILRQLIGFDTVSRHSNL